MTRSKKTKLQSQYTLDFSLIGIVCPMKEYKLGWHLNQLGIFHLVKNADVEIEFSGNNTIRISNLVEETEYSTVHLLRNKLQHPNSLQLNYLIPELQQFDYLIKISNSLNDDWSAEILSELKNCEAVDYCVSIDLDKVKAKDNLIF